MNLVQIYDRPMKISLVTPILPIWQTIINQRMEELQNEFQDKKLKCESSFELFLETYNIKEDVAQEPIEFINFSFNNFEEMYYPLFAKKECKIALGIRYANPLIEFLQNNSLEEFPSDLQNSLTSTINKIKSSIQNINVKAIFNNELLHEILNSKEFSILSKIITSKEVKVKNIDVHITKESFSNFSLSDNELIQPSFDPTNKLMGVYISRNENIYQIFFEKFNEIFMKGIPINQYLDQFNNFPFDEITELQSFVLCLL